jgi:sugar lactone lactonase YvrE
MVDTSGIISTVAGNGFGAGTMDGGYSGDGGRAVLAQLNYPIGVSVDGAGRIFIADYGNKRIRRVAGKGEFVPFNEIPRIYIFHRYRCLNTYIFYDPGFDYFV